VGADGRGPSVDDRVPFGDAVGVELDELDERSRRGHGGLIGQQVRHLLAQFRGVGVLMHHNRVLCGCGDQFAGFAADRQRAASVVGDGAAVDGLPDHGDSLPGGAGRG